MAPRINKPETEVGVLSTQSEVWFKEQQRHTVLLERILKHLKDESLLPRSSQNP